MSSFRAAFDFIIMNPEIEGGGKFTDDPDDAGGKTRYGIAQNFNPDVDVENLDEQGACDWYEANVWKKSSCDKMPYAMGLALFNAVINPGPGAGPRLFQKALGLKADGQIGPKTIAAANDPALDLEHFLNKFFEEIGDYYLSRNNVAEEKFEAGWIKRLIMVTNRCARSAWKGDVQ